MSKALQIKGFSQYYITDTGDVYSRVRPNNYRIKKLKTVFGGTSGYPFVGLWKEGKHYNKMIHRIVAETFIPNPENKPQVNHIDGNKFNNNVSNLEWVTDAENKIHKYHVLGYSSPNKNKFGKDNPKAKIVQQIKDGVVIAEYHGIGEVKRITGIGTANVSACCRGVQHSAGGYQWKYKGC